MEERSNICCLSNSAYVVAKTYQENAPLCHTFIENFSSLLSEDAVWRGEFRERCGGQNAVVFSQTNLSSAVDLGHQIFYNFAIVVEMLHDFHPRQWVTHWQQEMLDVLDQSQSETYPSGKAELHIELASMIVTLQPLSDLYTWAGSDSSLGCCEAYDKWNLCIKSLEAALHSTIVQDIARHYLPGDYKGSNTLVDLTQAKIELVLAKMHEDTVGRLAESMKIFRGCRLLNYSYLHSQSLHELELELIEIKNIPAAIPVFDQLSEELPRLKRLADTADHRGNKWDFWVSRREKFPNFFKVAVEAALIVTSSLSVDRLCAPLLLGDDDYCSETTAANKSTAIIMKYNSKMRKSRIL